MSFPMTAAMLSGGGSGSVRIRTEIPESNEADDEVTLLLLATLLSSWKRVSQRIDLGKRLT